MITKYDKLVRDKIPEVIEKSGKRVVISKIIDDEQFLFYLSKKLLEETNEYIESHEIEELADIVEVIHSIIKHRGFSFEQLDDLRKEKLEERGGFVNRIQLKEVIS